MTTAAVPAATTESQADENLAQVFYGLKSEPKPAVVPKQEKPAKIEAEKTYELMPKESDKFYGETAVSPKGEYKDLIPEILEIADRARMPEKSKELFGEAATFFHSHDFTREEAAKFQKAIKETIISPPSTEKLSNWEVESYHRLRQMYGKDWRSRLELAKAYVHSNPGLRQVLDLNFAGSRPEVVMALVDRVWKLRANGRLRLK